VRSVVAAKDSMTICCFTGELPQAALIAEVLNADRPEVFQNSGM
jgi:hypothetical protein